MLADEINNYTARVNAINTCEALTKLSAEINEKLQQMLDDINSQIEELSPFASLNPSDLPSVIDAVKLLIKKYSDPYIIAVAQLAQVTAAITTLTASIANKAASLGC